MRQLPAERKRETPGRHLDDPGSNPKLILSTLFITQFCHCRALNDPYIRCLRGYVIESAAFPSFIMFLNLIARYLFITS